MAHLTPFQKRRQRVRMALHKNGRGRLRLSVHRSSRHIYAQIIDDKAAHTLASASTLGMDLHTSEGANKVSGGNIVAATEVGKKIAVAAKKAGVTQVLFDRGGFLYHGRIKALADAARAGGLEF